MSAFEGVFKEIDEAFARKSKIDAIKCVRFLTPLTVGLKESKSYIERFWDLPDGLSRLREDLAQQLGISKEVPAETKPGARIIRSGKLFLTVNGEVTWDELNEFFGKVSGELGI